MKVLLIWEDVPDSTKLYSLEGELADIALAAAGHYINGNENAALHTLNEKLGALEPLGNGACHESFDISGHDRVVICGFIM